MRTCCLLIAALVLTALLGCTRSTPPPDPGEVRVTDVDAQPTGGGDARVEPIDDQGLDRDDAADPSEPDEFGFVADIGDLPECDVTWGTEDDGRIVKYADLDGDLVPEALAVGALPKKTGPARANTKFFTAFWNDGEWQPWYEFEPDTEIDGFGEDTIAFAYDLNGDGIVELGLLFKNDIGGMREFWAIYLFQVTEDGLRPARDHAEAALLGEFIRSSDRDSVNLSDVTDEYPGEELVIAQPSDRDALLPRNFEVSVWGWREGAYGIVGVYETDQEFSDVEAAFEAFEEAPDEWDPIGQ